VTESHAGFGSAAPIFNVQSLEASLAYYVDRLGFKIDWQHPALFASVSRDRCTIFLCEGDQGHAGTWVWIGVDDAERMHEEYRRNGAMIRHKPTNYDWAFEMQVEDPDGNVLRMGSEPREGEPIGEWLDMHRRRWVRTPEGGHLCLDP
jgi:catechol 2,3-dioxygenase-like lactoylglutathione lyase family enzyme